MIEHQQTDWTLIYTVITMILTIITACAAFTAFIIMRSCQHYLKTIIKNIDFLKTSQLTITGNIGTQSEAIKTALQSLAHDHKTFNQTHEDYSKALARIERFVTDVKDNQASYLNKNSNEANGNRVKVYTDKQSPDVAQSALMNTFLHKLVELLQDRTPPTP